MDGDRVVGVHASRGDETMDLHAPLVIDASGRDLFSVSRQDWRVPDPALKKIAVWTYFRGAKRDCGIDEGATTVAYLPGKGWFWYIPLPDDIVSVGVVAERDYLYRGERDPDTIFAREVGRPAVDRRAPRRRREARGLPRHRRLFVPLAPLRMRRPAAGR